MKQLNFLVSLLMAIVCSVGIARAAERVAPTFPEAKTLESGKEYYLYNVGSQGFLAPLATNTYYAGCEQTSGLKVTITQISEGCYSVLLSTGKYMGISSNSELSLSNSSYSSNYGSFNFIATATPNEYNIQAASVNSYYDETEFIGTTTGDSKVYSNLIAENNIIWKLIDAVEGDMYFARLGLYNALVAMDGTGYNYDKFEEIYADESSTVEEIISATALLNDAKSLTDRYVAPDWNDYPMLFERSTDNNWRCTAYSTGTVFEAHGSSTLSVTVVVDEPSTLSYDLHKGNSSIMKVLVNETETFLYDSYEASSGSDTRKFFIELGAGKHLIQWVFETPVSEGVSLKDIGVEKTPSITVNLLEAGSLGTEILYNVNHIKDVRKLKVIGQMNDDDWSKIAMMSETLYTLDLSETDVTAVADRCFDNSGATGATWSFLHSVKLPEGLKSIGRYSFYHSFVTDINFPSTLESIGEYAFNNSCINRAILPESCLTLGDRIFQHCYFLTESKLSSSLTTIPAFMYEYCYHMSMKELPSALKIVEEHAFDGCYNFSADLPESLNTIEDYAFRYTNNNAKKTDLIIPKDVSYIGESAFEDSYYTYVELPTAFYNADSRILPSTTKTIKINCPAVVETANCGIIVNGNNYYDDNLIGDVGLIVPSFLVNAYKLDDYWYNFKSITGFSTETIDEWTISADLVLGARDRMLGTPSLTLTNTGSLKINGDDEMPINNLYLNVTPKRYQNTSGYHYDDYYARIFSNADGVTIAGELVTCMDLRDVNFWYYLSLPYDVKVSDINNGAGGLCAVRYYDGANRAVNGATGNWKNYAADAIISAGTGFIIQVNTTGKWYFPAQDNASKQYITSNKIFAKELAENASENASDRGWNLIGNPYQSWYNIHKLNFTAPITVRTHNNQYEAYSVIDDDYAIAPNQAFFVQRPTEVATISFPLDGRQMTSEITDQNNARDFVTKAPGRLLTDIVVSNGTASDRTRVVLNEKATALYDMGSDANKFMADNVNAPQIYTIDNNGTRYAINERPVADGVVRLGFRSNGGAFVFSLNRNMSETVVLIDNETGLETDLTMQDYSFMANAGTDDKRFVLHFHGETTGVDGISGEKANIAVTDNGISVTNATGIVEVFNVNGVKVASVSGNADVQLSAGVYVVKTAEWVKKVVVK